MKEQVNKYKNIYNANIIDIFKFSPLVQDVLKEFKQDSYSVYVNGVTPHVNYLLAYCSFVQSKDDFVFYVAENAYKAQLAYDVFCRLAGYENVNLYIVDEVAALETVAVSRELKQERLIVLKNILNNNKKIIVTHIAAFLKPILSLENFKKGVLNYKVTDEIDVDLLIKKLSKMGYKRVSTTQDIGEYSVRGEIIDIYPSCYEKPVRINLGFDEIDSIKYFDISTQMTTQKINEVEIMPINDFIIWGDVNKLKEKLINIDEENRKFIENDFEEYQNFNNIDKLLKYIKYIDCNYTNISEYLDNKIVFYDNIKKQEQAYESLMLDIHNYYSDKVSLKKLELELYLDFYSYDYHVNKKVFLGALNDSIHGLQVMGIHGLDSYKTINYQNNLKMLCDDLKEKKFCVIALRTLDKINFISNIFDENDIKYKVTDIYNLDYNKVNIVLCENGISFGLSNLIEVICEDEIFGSNSKQKVRYRSVNENTMVLTKTEDLQVGDYVVHYDYGICKYLGIITEELNDSKNDYLSLQFDNMRLSVPIEKITDLEKYIGSEGSVPKLSKLGTNEWERRKKQVREQLETIAKDLIEIQVERGKAKGVVYLPDSEFQKEFESDFIYEETLDQKKAIEDVKGDMEKGILMDRLICGDVGFGKTEIAMRAAFKTVFQGKQVVYLAPTTILTRQHYHTFKERFDKFGIKVALLNRLISEKEQKDIIKKLRTGEIEIVIGTHRLLNKEIGYKDLGLLIIDEEQRFGVSHKEAIKKLKNTVNVLTLTATPIPRTLQMAVTGIRHLSLLETPPKNRYPIQTYVIEYNQNIIKEAIYRELARGGQVFYLHNKISDIEQVKKKINKLVPEARICIGHGNMPREELEDVVSAFIDKQFDVFVCTTIIETGIDIPNSNTLIVDDATRLGLAQMYQLRGRVGRSDRIAYAYFAYDGVKALSAASKKRLDAIKEYTQVGSGYRIAVRDLAIRGAGDILGKQQSGFINSIGMDMYMKLLNEAINKVKGIEEETKVKYKINVSKYVDKEYVSDDDIIIYIHKQINKIDSKEKKESVISELTDRFGKLSEDILIYIEERYLESLLQKYNVYKILDASALVNVILPKEISEKIVGEKLLMNGYKLSERFIFEYNKLHQIIIKVKKNNNNDKSWIYLLTKLLENDYFKKDE